MPPDPLRPSRIELLDAAFESIDAAIDAPERLPGLIGGEVARGWEGFPEALPALRDSALMATGPGSGSGAHWGSVLFVLTEPRTLVGLGGYYGPPADGVVEIGYAIAPAHRGRGLATEAAGLLVERAFVATDVRAVQAHTLAEPNASTRVLERLGFDQVGVEEDPDEGPVWVWRLTTTPSPAAP